MAHTAITCLSMYSLEDQSADAVACTEVMKWANRAVKLAVAGRPAPGFHNTEDFRTDGKSAPISQ
jgi:hypothetical protein